MKKTLLLLITLCCGFCYGQNYNVSIYQQIADNKGGFNAAIDNADWFGYSVESIGDLNGDGIEDVVVGSLKDDDGGFNRGALYVLFLNRDGEVDSYQKISDTEGGFQGVLDDWDIFGSSISYLGDINNDGFTEIGVGAEYDGDGGYWHGAVWILSLDSNGIVQSYSKISDTEGGFLAPLGDEDVFGTDIASLGDLNGDGFGDIVVSARRDPDGGSDRGAVYILFLNNDLSVNNYQKISQTQGNFQGYLDPGDYFGGAVANIGDIDLDGVVDIAVGAYRDDDGGIDQGAVYVLFLNSDGSVKDYQKISDVYGGLETTFNNGMFFGTSIDLAYDINDNGLTEIIVGAKGYWNEENSEIGAFYILELNNNGTVNNSVRYTKGEQFFDGDVVPESSFGFSVSYNRGLSTNDAIVIGAHTTGDINGFENGSLWILQLGKILSIDDIDGNNEQILVYPNPTNNSFSLHEIDDILMIQIFDSQGKEIISFKDIKSNNFDVSFLPVGVYVILIKSNNEDISSYKLIKN
ncbi:T9SS type A sorting domain-containing protein [Marixanthomonas spongiae]|uniref:Secretion system C-terminal sorting domain-containing protein n=1 Tax=Marixanthomonas spongiae TaxID=2174845 RepID=A0A2U0HWW2_9FLAO|nr:T9SS type A sorting domain-containing protein [Marixanthomonas spongiae]PVW13316.1 hypothetical protein DDV96_13185 [Marixanthomonas spongiae]